MPTSFVSYSSGTTITSADLNAHSTATNNLEVGSTYFVITTGSANAYVAAPSPASASYVAGQIFNIKANFTNTGASTINVSAIGAQAIKRIDGSALIGGEIVSGSIYTLIYDGTNFVMVGKLSVPQEAETPSGTINSSNVTFNLAHTPLPAASLQLFLNGAYQVQGGGMDYTISGATITFAVAPPTGQKLRAHYKA